MMTDSTAVKILHVDFDLSQPELTIISNWYIIGAIILFGLIVFLVYRKFFINKYQIVEMDLEVSGSPKTKFKVKRDDSNVFIANRIYIELITRKAALPVDEDNDVIVEIYDSWYKLFGIIRDEIKNVPGHYLQNHDPTKALIGLTTNILNYGLRPHLTTFQARFRKWFEDELEKETNKNKTPQELQKEYPEFENLLTDMKSVNNLLIEYSEELNKLIKGK